MIFPDLTGAEFRKSSYSVGGNDCVEVATNLPVLIAPTRDHKTLAPPRGWGCPSDLLRLPLSEREIT
ncbi:DUF397 domain-containing protein [Streptosporangium sp. NBC_01495]|uniref:DUF397 domain-containing protein n=1 Tax=Streptosporangium sp. NBC_01495 TaxID=2903899 RepID=UPI002E3215FC|nr:DUF397 domain-containing protein [Streptosporangium sp. NBC_01495]